MWYISGNEDETSIRRGRDITMPSVSVGIAARAFPRDLSRRRSAAFGEQWGRERIHPLLPSVADPLPYRCAARVQRSSSQRADGFR
jgi:hypothetical protein